MVSIMADEKEYLLTAHDRCDANCPAQARVLVKMMDGELYFCGNHFARWEDKLTSLSYEIIDERDRIDEKSESSA